MSISPKAHGAWMGSGSGALIGSVIIGLIQSYITHKAVPLALQTLIMGLTSSITAYVGAYILPLVNNVITPTPAPDPPTPGPVVSPTPAAPLPAPERPVNDWGQS